jgi:hypothetical protein
MIRGFNPTVHYVLYINYVLNYVKDVLLLRHNILHQIGLLCSLLTIIRKI